MGSCGARSNEPIGELLQSHGLAAIVYPTQPMAAPLISPAGDLPSDEIEINGKQVNKGLIFIRNTHVTCALGVPGLALPAGLTSQGLPVGLELDGLAGGDSELLAPRHGRRAGMARSCRASGHRLTEGELRVGHAGKLPQAIFAMNYAPSPLVWIR